MMKKAPLFTEEELAELRGFDRMVDREALTPSGKRKRITKFELSYLFDLFLQDYSSGAAALIAKIPSYTVQYYWTKWRKQQNEKHLAR